MRVAGDDVDLLTQQFGNVHRGWLSGAADKVFQHDGDAGVINVASGSGKYSATSSAVMRSEVIVAEVVGVTVPVRPH